MPTPEEPPVRSALTLRLVLAVFGLVVCVVLALFSAAGAGPVWVTVGLVLLVAVTIVDIAVIIARKRRGEPG